MQLANLPGDETELRQRQYIAKSMLMIVSATVASYVIAFFLTFYESVPNWFPSAVDGAVHSIAGAFLALAIRSNGSSLDAGRSQPVRNVAFGFSICYSLLALCRLVVAITVGPIWGMVLAMEVVALAAFALSFRFFLYDSWHGRLRWASQMVLLLLFAMLSRLFLNLVYNVLIPIRWHDYSSAVMERLQRVALATGGVDLVLAGSALCLCFILWPKRSS
jgi:hypothetical protein